MQSAAPSPPLHSGTCATASYRPRFLLLSISDQRGHGHRPRQPVAGLGPLPGLAARRGQGLAAGTAVLRPPGADHRAVPAPARRHRPLLRDRPAAAGPGAQGRADRRGYSRRWACSTMIAGRLSRTGWSAGSTAWPRASAPTPRHGCGPCATAAPAAGPAATAQPGATCSTSGRCCWPGRRSTVTCGRSPATTSSPRSVTCTGTAGTTSWTGLRSLFAFCKKRKSIFRSPVQGIRVGEYPQGVIQPLSQNEVDQAAEAAAAPGARLGLVLAAMHAARVKAKRRPAAKRRHAPVSRFWLPPGP
jgi:hypothetical protein